MVATSAVNRKLAVQGTSQGQKQYVNIQFNDIITVFAMGFTGLRHWLQRSGSATVAIPAFNNMQFNDTVAVFGMGFTVLRHLLRREGSATVAIPAFNNMQFNVTITVVAMGFVDLRH